MKMNPAEQSENTISGENDVTLKIGDDTQEIVFNENKNITKTEQQDGKSIIAYSVAHNGVLIILLPTEEAAGKEFDSILYDVCCSALNPKKKNSFWKRFIPCSGDTPFDVIRKVVLIVAIITFIVSASMLVNILVIRPAVNDNTTGSIRELLVSTTETDEEGNEITKKPTDGSQGTLVDFSKLLSENKDTVGWIKIPNTRIDYVVVQPPENEDHEYYLYRDFYGNYDVYGTVFMDYRSSLDSKNLILHGHHMQDGRMFANILNYEDFDFYKKTPTFTFNTIYEKSEWKIISVLKTNTLEEHGKFFNYLRGDFDSDYDFLNFVYQIRERSLYDCPVDENDTLVTLSTCTYDFSEFRFVVVARRVRDGENAKVDVSKAKVNPDTLYPDVWYNVRGGTKPDVTTFQEAYNEGKIDWYDGKNSKWSEKDDEKLEKVLNEGKKNALKGLQDYISSNKYLEDDQKKLNDILDKYKKLINDATSGKEVNELYNEAYREFSKIKTAKEISEEQEKSDKEVSKKELSNAKISAKTAIKDSIAGNKYYTAERLEVESLIKEYNSKIDSAKTVEAVETFKKDAISKISEIKTFEEKDKEKPSEQESSEQKPSEQESSKPESSKAESSIPVEEPTTGTDVNNLKKEKDTAINRISSYKDKKFYYTEQQKEIDNIINVYKDYINKSESNEQINNYIRDALKELDKVKTSAMIDEERKPPVEEPTTGTDTEKLEEERNNAINTIHSYLDINLYAQDQQVEIYSIYSKYEELINSCESIDQIKEYIGNATRELDTVKTSSEVNEDQSSDNEETTQNEEV